MKIKELYLASFLLYAACSTLQAQTTHNIAHRGFWKTTGSAQNSITALIKADSVGCYGSEFDVWLTTDHQLVVNHDATFRGVTIQDATAQVCTAIELDNGESLPTLQHYLQAAQTLKTRLILELKTHRTSQQETYAVKAIIQMIREMGLEERVEYITFSKHAISEFVRLAPQGTPVYYLEGDLPPQALKELGCAGADYHFSVFRKHPEWIEECHQLGMKVNVWTVNETEEMEWLINHGVDFITTNEPLLLNEAIRRK